MIHVPTMLKALAAGAAAGAAVVVVSTIALTIHDHRQGVRLWRRS